MLADRRRAAAVARAVLTMALAVPPVADAARRTAVEYDNAVGGIANADVVWRHGYIGIWPEVEGAGSQRVLELGVGAAPALVRALVDPDRFVAAHVLLTELLPQRLDDGLMFFDASSWSEEEYVSWYLNEAIYDNCLILDQYQDGATMAPPEQRWDLADRWRQTVRSPADAGVDDRKRCEWDLRLARRRPRSAAAAARTSRCSPSSTPPPRPVSAPSSASRGR